MGMGRLAPSMLLILLREKFRQNDEARSVRLPHLEGLLIKDGAADDTPELIKHSLGEMS